MNLTRDPDRNADEIDTAGRDWCNRFAAHPDRSGSPAATAVPDRAGKPFSVALIGNRFNNPKIAHMLAPVMAALSRRGVSLYVYSDDVRASLASDALGRDAKRWTSIRGVDPETVAAILRGDGIDIAIDLTGFGPGARIATYAWRPARVCLSWCGSAMTAAQTCDWTLTGPLGKPADAAGHDAGGAAGVPAWHLPETPMVYPAPPNLMEPGPLPMLDSGQPTLGVAMSLGAIGGATLRQWSDLLAAIPDARLLIANVARLDDDCVARAYEQISHAGLRQRAAIIDFDDDPQVELEFWRYIDIAIDPQPFGSFGRTAQALWMGVPVIAIDGPRLESRAGAAALAAAGKSDWVAEDNAGMCRRVAALLRDSDALAALRAGLPAAVAASKLTDAESFADALLAAFREMLIRADKS